jgi:hypothetical protein
MDDSLRQLRRADGHLLVPFDGFPEALDLTATDGTHGRAAYMDRHPFDPRRPGVQGRRATATDR